MKFRLKRTNRVRWLFMITVVSVSLYYLLDRWFIYSPVSEDFLELNACPACFGIGLCHLFKANHVHLSGWQRFSFFNSDMFNVKNVYYGTLNNESVVFKKLAHQTEWLVFDDCLQNRLCSSKMKIAMSVLLPCSNLTFISYFNHAFISSTGFKMPDSEISLKTAMEINLEPIVLSALSNSDLPIPSYYGACGRVGVFSYEGSNFVAYLQASFQFRAFLARELLISMHQLNIGDSNMIIYYPDVNLENFVYNSHEQRVKIIDLENVVIVERSQYTDSIDQKNYSDQIKFAWNSNRFCNTYKPDYNVQQVCRSILSPPTKTDGSEISVDFLHSIPEHVHHQYNLTNLRSLSNENETQTNGATTIDVSSSWNAEEFFQEVRFLQSNIDRIDELTRNVKRMHIEMLEPTVDPKKGQELETCKAEVKALAYETSAKLQDMQQAQDDPEHLNSSNAERRIKGSQIFVMTRRFRDVMLNYNEEAVVHRERCVKAIMTEFDLTGTRKTKEELEELLENDFPGTFNFSIFVDKDIPRLLNAVEARRNDILKLEKSIKELLEIFLDLTTLVEKQGEMMDCIEYNVSKAVNYVERAVENVDKAQYYQERCIRKIICICVILFVSIFAIILISIFGYFWIRRL